MSHFRSYFASRYEIVSMLRGKGVDKAVSV
jgi:hypothetical protein